MVNLKELEEMEEIKDWESMLIFAIKLIEASAQHQMEGIWGERIMILHLDHANELLMKAFLIKNDYIISYVDKNDLKKGLKKSKLLDKDKTITYGDALSVVCKEIIFERNKQKKMLEFHKLRNEIQHRSTNIPLNKQNKIINFYPHFKELYELMFPEFAEDFPNMFRE